MTRQIIGTRGSDLALTQANLVKDALRTEGIESEIRVIKTIGDKRPDLKLSEFSTSENSVHDKGIFTKELEEALLAEEIDFAVHSLKDVPTELADPFEICATLPRAPISDVILATQEGTIDDLRGYSRRFKRVQSAIKEGTIGDSRGYNGPPSENPLAGRTVATSSVRRARQLKWSFPGVNVVDIRGNVPTRIRKLIENSDWDAIVLARAGIERLRFYHPDKTTITLDEDSVFTHELPPHFFPPAASQGAVAMEILKTNQTARAALEKINHGPTFSQITAERSFLAALQAGCQTPVGIFSEFTDSGATLELHTIVFSESDPEAEPRTGKLSIPVNEVSQAGNRLLDLLS